MLKKLLESPQGLRAAINANYNGNERDCIKHLIDVATLNPEISAAVAKLATQFVTHIRAARKKTTGIDSFLSEYALSTDEGIALMCLAEALLRVPDNATIDRLIKDKLSNADWKSHQGQSHSFFVNATTWALMLTGKVLSPLESQSRLKSTLMKLINRSSDGVVRKACDQAMRIMSRQFVTGRTITEAIKRARKKEDLGYRYSYDMLGEAAISALDAERYFNAYKNAIIEIGTTARVSSNVFAKPGISIKLSALHPRYQESQSERVLRELSPILLSLAQLAKKYDIALTIDAEESERLDLSLDVIERVFNDPSLDGWHGFGIAIQSYQKRAFYLLDWVCALARAQKRRIMVRLIKGAYWDSEIKKAQMLGLSDYPVFTRKLFTDISFQACAKKILTMTDAIYPQFATHNAYSVALILSLVGEYRDFEFQCLHGMGSELYAQIVPATCLNIPCRIYAPVGTHEDLLPYLVRRLLENGANSSFVNRIVDDHTPIAELIADPLIKAHELLPKLNHNIPLPADIFLTQRKNSLGINLNDRATMAQLQQDFSKIKPRLWQACSLLANSTNTVSETITVYAPSNRQICIGTITMAGALDVDQAIDAAVEVFDNWSQSSIKLRINYIERFANLLQEHRTTLLSMLCLEAGKTWPDAVGELREAIDFCRYYAVMGAKLMGEPQHLSGYTGELNELSLHPRGTVLCISPWNFPLAIFVGQVVAALITGNCVIAKPAEQSSLIAYFSTQLLHEAGIPKAVMQLLLGDGETIGAALVRNLAIKAVIFTGSTQTAYAINRALALKPGAIIPLIAETGGQNTMIVDSSALLEQVVVDVINSAFGSAGQRCSALRVLYIQAEIYPRFITLLQGAMAQLCIGDPRELSTDIGPVIDASALTMLTAHVETMRKKFDIIYQCNLNPECEYGYFMPPTAIAIDSINALNSEIFGPILHVISYKSQALDQIIAEINNSNYGLTLGIHSRINTTIDYIRARIHVGNCYVNRNMIGAVVGLQPFGGEGLSGTGPKAGGPNYLQRLCHERTYTIDTTAAGGNASLMSLAED